MHSTRLRKQQKALELAKAEWAKAKSNDEKAAIAARFFDDGQGFVEEVASIADAAEANDKRVVKNDEGRAALNTALRNAGYDVQIGTDLGVAAQAVTLNTRRQGRRAAAEAKAETTEAAKLRSELEASGVLPKIEEKKGDDGTDPAVAVEEDTDPT